MSKVSNAAKGIFRFIICVAAIALISWVTFLAWFVTYGNFIAVIVGFLVAVFISWLINKREIKKTLLFWGEAAACVIIIVLLVNGITMIKDANEQNRIDTFINNTDEVLYYKDQYHYGYDILNTKFREHVILLDYDNMKIAFIYHHNFLGFTEYQLKKVHTYPLDDTNIQIQADLSSPAKQLTTYYPADDMRHMTSEIQVVMEDGSVYTIEDIVDENTGRPYEYLGLSSSQYYVGRRGEYILSE